MSGSDNRGKDAVWWKRRQLSDLKRNELRSCDCHEHEEEMTRLNQMNFFWLRLKFFSCFFCHQQKETLPRRSEDAMCDVGQSKRSAFRVSTRKSGYCHNSSNNFSIVAFIGNRCFCRKLMSRLDDSVGINATRAAAFLSRCGFDSDSIDSGRVKIYDFV